MVVGMLACAPGIVGAEERAHDNVAFVNPALAPFGYFSCGLERVFRERASVAVGGSYFTFIDPEAYSAGLWVQPHFYFGRHPAPRGPYVAPYVQYGFFTHQGRGPQAGEYYNGYSYEGGATAGWAFQPGPANARVLLNLKLGLGLGYRLAQYDDTTPNNAFSGLVPTADLKVGAAF